MIRRYNLRDERDTLRGLCMPFNCDSSSIVFASRTKISLSIPLEQRNNEMERFNNARTFRQLLAAQTLPTPAVYVTIFAKIAVISVKYTAISRLFQAWSNYSQRVQYEFRIVDSRFEILEARENMYRYIKSHARESPIERMFDLSWSFSTFPAKHFWSVAFD